MEENERKGMQGNERKERKGKEGEGMIRSNLRFFFKHPKQEGQEQPMIE